MPEEHRDILFETIKIATNSMRLAVEQQLSDFLPGGRFSTPPSDDDLTRTEFAHNTNLGCEHHFGDLDSIQRRRPSATMHHHSSIQSLKRNRSCMTKWLNDMPVEARKDLLKSARKGGKNLRQHRNEPNVLSEIHADLLSQKAWKRKREGHSSERRNRRKEKETDTDCAALDIEKQLFQGRPITSRSQCQRLHSYIYSLPGQVLPRNCDTLER
jgi:hypothetical protein